MEVTHLHIKIFRSIHDIHNPSDFPGPKSGLSDYQLQNQGFSLNPTYPNQDFPMISQFLVDFPSEKPTKFSMAGTFESLEP